MKLWKGIGLAALAAALIPYRVEKDETDDSTVYESLLMRVRAGRFLEEESGQLGHSFDVDLLPLLHRSAGEQTTGIDGFDNFDEFYLRDETFEESLQRGEDEQEDMKDVFEAAAAAGADAVRDYTGAEDEAPREGFADPKIVVTPAE